MAGHKGYGLALLVEVLAAVLTGAAVTRQVGSWIFDDPSAATGHGAAFLALEVGVLMPLAAFTARIDQLIAEVRQSPRAQGADRVCLPGELEWERRDRALQHGLLLPPEVVAPLRALAQELGLPLPGADA
jgi:LDH2 family malate/lactate/ureidoglycolate dehydrogenase